MQSFLSSLFTPLRIGPMTVKNRIVMPPMVTGFAGLDWGVSDQLIRYHIERAKGGVGMIIVESSSVDPVGVGPSAHLGIFDDNLMAGLNELAEAVKAHDVKVGLQLGHTGRQAKWVGRGIRPVAPSPIKCKYVSMNLSAKEPRALTITEIKDLVCRYAECAYRVRSAGFDLVEVHAAHGYLVNEFMSPYTNHRRDEYGGSLEGRMKFPLEVLSAIRGTVGEDFPVSFRINGDDYIEGGLTLEETPFMAQMLEKGGASLIHVSGSIYESIFYEKPKMFQIQPMCVSRGCFVHLAERIKQSVNIPVIAVGRINDPLLADEIIREGKADLVSMGRALIADPQLPIKAKEGRFEDIRKCIACNTCITRVFKSYKLKCAVNADVGKEKEHEIKKSENPRRIMVVGGGPAGMEAARLAALSGHHVSLFERDSNLGGQLQLASKPPYKAEIMELVTYLANQLKKLGVEVSKGLEVTPDLIEQVRPDVVLLATGSKSSIPDLEGIDSPHVLMARAVLKKGIGALGENPKVIVIGGGTVGCETAELIYEASEGLLQVTIVEMAKEACADMDPTERAFLIQRLKERGIQLHVNMRASSIKSKGLLAIDSEGNEHFLEGEMIILALGGIPERDLAASLDGKNIPLYPIGDCKQPGNIFNAIHTAAHAVRTHC